MKKFNKINSRVRFLEDSLLIDKKILVVTDLHLGYEENFLKSGLIPRCQYKEIIEKFERIFNVLQENNLKIEKVVILGDLKHEFSDNSYSEWEEVSEILLFIKRRCKQIIIVRGNHDNYLANILKKTKFVKFETKHIYKDICFMHGDKRDDECFKKAKIIVLGHLHPAITLYDKYKKEKYKCFLAGKLEKKEIYILPSFIPLSLGYDLNNILEESGKKNNFFVINNDKLKKFRVIIYNYKEDNIYEFGEVGNAEKE